LSTHIIRETSITTTARTCAYLAELIRKDVVDPRRDRIVLSAELDEDLAKIGLVGDEYANRQRSPLPPRLPSVDVVATAEQRG
jgi:hypothetical protein